MPCCAYGCLAQAATAPTTLAGRMLRALLAPARWAWRRVHGVRSRMLAIGDGANDVAMIQVRWRGRYACARASMSRACLPILGNRAAVGIATSDK